MKKKYCKTCETDVNITEFRPNKTKKDGLQEKCIPCDKKYAKEYYDRNKKKCVDRTAKNRKLFAKRFQEFKEKLSCIKCGENESVCLDFHHTDSKEKYDDVSKLVSRGSWDTLMEEVNKCIVVCSNCHRKIHKYGLEKILKQ